MSGLEDGDQDTTDPTSIQGAYLSFLHLRHLRIRDSQRMVCNHDVMISLNWFHCWTETASVLVYCRVILSPLRACSVWEFWITFVQWNVRWQSVMLDWRVRMRLSIISRQGLYVCARVLLECVSIVTVFWSCPSIYVAASLTWFYIFFWVWCLMVFAFFFFCQLSLRVCSQHIVSWSPSQKYGGL